MKSIKELGLEIIELEDQILLVDEKGKLSDGDWFYNNFDDNQSKIQQKKGSWATCYNEFKIISSTKPLEGLPLLVIEDDVEKLAEHSSEVQEATYTSQHKTTYKHGFIDGFNKAKETYKFTEEDLRNAIQHGGSIGYNYASQETYLDSQEMRELEEEQDEDVENYIQSLTKKELWVEVEEHGGQPMSGPFGTFMFGTKFRPNVSQGKIKAVWK